MIHFPGPFVLAPEGFFGMQGFVASYPVNGNPSCFHCILYQKCQIVGSFADSR